ncbi:asparaginase domain-containing protein [Mesorhizobium sp. ZMM04-5]|uniref:Asparaginase domain-containing protein n=1 Tax=Mesorhizobium marinum TaxID=3228790 RepID=A0ABV3R4M6_9HYPH
MLDGTSFVYEDGSAIAPPWNICMQSVRIIVTGGTIDKVHDILTETLGFSGPGRSQIPELLKQARCEHPVVEILMQKDSLEFEDRDRQAIAAAVEAAPEKSVVVTHGTGTMDRTARFLGPRVSDKTVVLTGAMRPFSLGASDGPFNLGGAIIAAQILPHGVWGAMNGRIFPFDRLKKNTRTGRFDR